MPVTLSLAVVTNNHADKIGRALESAKGFCDEIVVVDLGSRDATRDIASSHGALVFESSAGDDMAAARNESFAHCQSDWIMWLDAEDVVPPASQPGFHAFRSGLAEQLVDIDVVVAPYHWDVNDLGLPAVVFHRERVVRRAAGLTWEGQVEERLVFSPDRFGLTADLVVEHLPDPVRSKHEAPEKFARLQRLIANGDQSARTLISYANAAYDQGRYGDAVAGYRNYLEAAPDGADRYWALVFLAESHIVIDDAPEAARCALEAIGEDASRAEAYMLLGRLRFAEEAWAEAAPLFVAASAATRPRLGLLREGDYTWGPWDYLAVCYDKLGQTPDAVTAAVRSLRGNPQADRVRANLHWMVDHL